MRTIATILILAVLAAFSASAETVVLTADRDATLIEDPLGQLASGAGQFLFVGRTGQARGSIRRALVRFDLGALPAHAVVESVRLRVNVSQASAGTSDITVHRLLADWGEGASASPGGAGVPAAPDDATWIHRFFAPAAPMPPASAASPHSRWESPGGDHAAAAGASTTVPGVGAFVFASPELAADVQEWLRKPKRNHGWILIGDESRSSTSRRIDSRHGMLPDQLPRLEVVYRRR